MPEFRQIGHERWIREPVQCILPPSVDMILQGSDTGFYLFRLVRAGESPLIEVFTNGESVASSKHHHRVLFFRRNTP